MPRAIAFRKLEQLSQPDNLRQMVAQQNRGETVHVADITSCSQTADMVVRTVTNQVPGVPLKGLRPLVNGGQTGVLTEEIRRKLKEPVVLYFQLNFTASDGSGDGDHHFCAFSLDENTVIVAMAWQGMYDFSDWFSENEQGRYTTENFLTHMRGIEDGSSTAVVDLCAYLGKSRSGMSVPAALLAEVQGARPTFAGAYFLDLPKR